MFKNLGHFFTSIGKHIVSAGRLIAQNVPAVERTAEATKPLIEGLTAAIYPPAVAVEELAYRLFGNALHTVHDAGDAAGSAGINLALDLQTVAEIKQLIPQIENFGKQIGAVKPVQTAGAGN